MRRGYFWVFLFLIFSLHAKKAPLHHFITEFEEEKIQPPWLTGPLLAPSSITIPPGHINIEPYIYIVANTGKYNHDWEAIKMETLWPSYSQPSIQIGVIKWMDFQFNPTLFYNYTKGAAKWAIGDMPIGLDFQLYRTGSAPTDWVMGLKLALKETIPIGKYKNLNPQKQGTDIGGQGSWQTGFGIIWGNLIYLGKKHFLSARLSLEYTLPAPVSIKNLNVYGGGPGTKGTVYPAQNFQIDIGTELTLTQNWAFALDIVGSWSGKVRFKGKTFFPNTAPSSAQFSLAPAIEYNWSANIGLIAGSWFTVAGRNSIQFASGIIAFNYYH